MFKRNTKEFLNEMFFYLKLYFQFLRLNMKRRMEYRGSFLLWVVAVGTQQIAIFALIWVILNRFHAVKDWSFPEMVVLVELRNIGIALYLIFFAQVQWLSRTVIAGDFDFYLTRPLPQFFSFMCSDFAPIEVIELGFALVLMGIGFHLLEIQWTLVKFLFLLVVIIGAGLIRTGVSFAINSLCFWLLKVDSLNFIVNQLDVFNQYPINIYSRSIQFALTFVIPYAFMNFYPASYFLSKESSILFHPFFGYITPLVGILCFSLALLVWKKGLNAYQSTGT